MDVFFHVCGCNPNYIKIVYCNNGGFFGGSNVDFVMFARQTFLEVDESLVANCKSNENVEE
jgi:hypothetical protein